MNHEMDQKNRTMTMKKKRFDHDQSLTQEGAEHTGSCERVIEMWLRGLRSFAPPPATTVACSAAAGLNRSITMAALSNPSKKRVADEMDVDDQEQLQRSCITYMDGLDLFLEVCDADFQARVVDYIEDQLVAGRAGKLPGKMYDAPSPVWAVKGQSREMIQYGFFTNSNRVFPAVTVGSMAEPILVELVRALMDRGVFKAGEEPDQCTVNVYQPGMWLPPHVDNIKFARPFATVSFVSQQSVVLGEKIDGANGVWKGDFDVSMPCGSALRLGGKAGGPGYFHAVPSPNARRISFTFRRLSTETHAEVAAERERIKEQREMAAHNKRELKRLKKAEKKAAKELRKKERAAAQAAAEQARIEEKKAKAISAKSTPLPPSYFNTYSSSSKNRLDATTGRDDGGYAVASNKRMRINEMATPFCETEHVQKVYDSIAKQWHGTRYKPWPKVAAFIERQPKGSLFGDIGCGNGKNWFACVDQGYGVGSDFSMALLNICNGMGQEVHSADALHLPYRDNIFDAVLSIAVLHHISSESRRMRLMSEAVRVLRPGGQALFYAWALEQELASRSGHVFQEQDVLVPWHVKVGEQGAKTEERVKEAREVVERAVASHGEVDEVKGAAVFQRYCHVYEKGELELLFERMVREHPTVEARIIDSYHDSGNWAMCVEKM